MAIKSCESENNQYQLNADTILLNDNYKNKSIQSQNEELEEIIYSNLELFQKDNFKSVKQNIQPFSNDTEKLKSKNKKNNNYIDKNFVIDYAQLENISIDILDYLLPPKTDINFYQKISLIMLHLRKMIDEYDNILYNTEELEMIEYIREQKIELSKKLEYIYSYAYEEEVKIQIDDDINTIYFSLNNQNLFLRDILHEDTQKYQSYLTMLHSLKNHSNSNFKSLKTSIFNGGIYQIRHDDQRIIFDILNNNTIIIISGFTKKVSNSRKYKQTLDNRLNKYAIEKQNIKEQLKNNYASILIKGIEDDAQVMSILENKIKKFGKKG